MIELTGDADRFTRRTAALLGSRVEYNVLATVLQGARDGLFGERSSRYAIVTGASGEVVGAALQTPPWPLLCTELTPGDVALLLDHWPDGGAGLPGASGPPATAQAIGAAWSDRTGGATRVDMRMAWHVLEQVREPARPAAGALRPAQEADLELLVDWGLAFAAEAAPQARDSREQLAGRTASRIARSELWLWEDGGEPTGSRRPVTYVGTHAPVAGVARVGPVYTPPALRNRGYASSAVAAVSRRLLQAGAQRCCLTTDLANPTSNHIYAEVGYRQVAGWEELSFLAA